MHTLLLIYLFICLFIYLFSGTITNETQASRTISRYSINRERSVRFPTKSCPRVITSETTEGRDVTGPHYYVAI